MYRSSLRTSLTLIYASLLVLVASYGAFAQQSPYQLDRRREIPLLGTGAAGVATGILLREQREPLTLPEVNQLDANDILALDRPTGSYSDNARIVSDALLISSFAAPLTLLAFEEARSDAGTLGLMLLETVLLNEALTGITKGLVKRPRPYTYNTDLPDMVRTADDNTFSFFSGHTSHSAALSFFTAQVLSEYVSHPEARTVIWVGAALLPAATGFFRYEAGKHFPTDVIVGYAVGASVGWLVPYLHRISYQRNDSRKAIRVVPHATGVVVMF